ncbi:MAG: FG-GAP repeat protein [Planctomycetes bacterium]|nr:FG-GAP repeat protein [Planctomycetota bacterium]
MNEALRIWSAASVISAWFLGAANVSYGQTVCQDARLTASDPGIFESFGYSVAVSGDTAIVGAQWDSELGTEAGAAYIFRLDPDRSTWIEQQKLLASDGDGGEHFGRSVTIDGDTAMIAATSHLHNGASGNGSVYVFVYNRSTWVEQQEFFASDGAIGDVFGQAVSISADVAVIGARFDDDNGAQSGSAYVFRFDPDTEQWVEEQKLLASDGAFGDFFGRSVAVLGDVVIIGADGHDDACRDDPVCNSGAAYVFRFNPETSQWVEEQKLLASDTSSQDSFGESVAISGDLALIGANGDGVGSAYVFRFDPKTSTWVQEQKLLPSGGQPEQFGRAAAIDGDTAVIGSPFADGGGPSSGAAYVFRHDPKTSQWSQQDMLLPDPNPWTNFFGRSVAIDGETTVIGAHGEDQQRGAAYVFDVALNCACPQDLDADGSVGVPDLLSLLGSWGPCPPKGDCPADFDNTGDVGVKDLLILLGNWGPCP